MIFREDLVGGWARVTTDEWLPDLYNANEAVLLPQLVSLLAGLSVNRVPGLLSKVLMHLHECFVSV